MKRIILLFLAVSFISVGVHGQRPEVTITLNETFFDSLFDVVFQNAAPIEFSIAHNPDSERHDGSSTFGPHGPSEPAAVEGPACKETIQIVRENSGVRSAVRFRDGKILAPLAFTGNYSPPFIGCVPFSGYAETSIEIELDQQNQRLIARARVVNVRLNGTGGVGGSVIARLVQGSIDKKVNPIELFSLEKVSFLLPVQKDSNLKMNAVGFRYQVL